MQSNGPVGTAEWPGVFAAFTRTEYSTPDYGGDQSDRSAANASRKSDCAVVNRKVQLNMAEEVTVKQKKNGKKDVN